LEFDHTTLYSHPNPSFRELLRRAVINLCSYRWRLLFGSKAVGQANTGSGDRPAQEDLAWNDQHFPVHVERVKTPVLLGNFAEARSREPFCREQCLRRLVVLLHTSKYFF